MRVLVVEDDPRQQDDLRLVLPPDLELVFADDSSQALGWFARGERFDAIVLDWALPPQLAQSSDGEGLALLESFRRHVAPDVPVIVFSGHDPDEVVPLATGLGAHACLEKSAGVAGLVQALEGIRDTPSEPPPS